jgi:hypothetical protein
MGIFPDVEPKKAALRLALLVIVVSLFAALKRLFLTPVNQDSNEPAQTELKELRD